MNEWLDIFLDARDILSTIGISIFASCTRIALWGWHGFGHAASCLFVGCFCGISAHWLMAGSSFGEATHGLIVSLAALMGRDALNFFLNRRTLLRLGNAAVRRAEHEILHRGRADGPADRGEYAQDAPLDAPLDGKLEKMDEERQ